MHAVKKMASGAQDAESSRLLDALPYYDQGYEASGTQEVVRCIVRGIDNLKLSHLCIIRVYAGSDWAKAMVESF